MILPIVYKPSVASDDSVMRFMALVVDAGHKTRVAELDELSPIFRTDHDYAVRHSSALAAVRHYGSRG